MLHTANVIKMFALGVRAIGLVSLVGLILCIVGSTSVTSLDQLASGQPLLSAGKILFAAVYVAVTVVTVFAVVLYYHTRTQRTQSAGEGSLILAVVIALPLILVRLIYAFLGTWGKDKAKYSPFTGSLARQIALSVWEEIAVSIVFIAIGFVVPKVSSNGDDANDVESKPEGASALRNGMI